MRFPSCDQCGRAAYPFRFVIFLGSEPSAFTNQSWRCSFTPGLEKSASVFESGAQAGSKSTRCPPMEMTSGLALAFPDVLHTYVSLNVEAAVDCTQATSVPSGESAISP